MKRVNSKVLIFGEYSILHNSMALTIPFEKFSGELCYPNNDESAKDDNLFAVLSNKGIREFCKHIIENHTDTTFQLNVQKMSKELEKGLFFKSDIPQGFGLGSSGALVAAVFLRYLEKAGDKKDLFKSLTKEKAQKLKNYLGTLESYFHGKSSGIDPLSILINKPLLLKEDKEIVEVEIPTFKENGENVIFLLNTGLSRNSEKLIGQFHADCQKEGFIFKLKNDLISYTNNSISDFLKGDTVNLYKNLEKLIHFQLEELSYLIPEKYKQIVLEGLNHNDYFLKICGSGGGGFMLGFTQKWEKTQNLLKNEELEILYKF